MSDHTERNPVHVLIGFSLLGLFAFLAIILLWGFFVATVPAGSVGIQDTFGSVHDDTLQPGFHLKSPFTSVNMMNTRTQKYVDYGTSDTASIVALSNDGMQTTMGIAVNFHINPSTAVELYKRVGLGYMDIVMVNPIHSVPRDLISKYDTKTLYSASKEGSTDRAMLEQELYEGIKERLNAVGVSDSIVIEQVSIRNIDFPQVYKDSITSKMRMDTEIQQKELEVKKQQMEAQRVVAEAEGEANANVARAKGEAEANRIRTASLSPLLLQYTWIQGMLNNNNTIYIPIDENGIPVIRTV
jgi:prohibitin 2